MNKRKFKKGAQIVSVAEFLEHEWFIVNGKTYHRGWCMSWTLKLAQVYVDRGVAYIAKRITNGEYYSSKTDEELQGMLDERLCDFCPLPDELKGVHCYGGEPEKNFARAVRRLLRCGTHPCMQ